MNRRPSVRSARLSNTGAGKRTDSAHRLPDFATNLNGASFDGNFFSSCCAPAKGQRGLTDGRAGYSHHVWPPAPSEPEGGRRAEAGRGRPHELGAHGDNLVAGRLAREIAREGARPAA